MDVVEKLEILADAAKYDVACTSSGIDRKGKQGCFGGTTAAGVCHAFSADGRCITLLKVLLSNACVYDCAYCVNRRSNDVPRVSFSPRELADLTLSFYRRNYIEGLFLSSGVIKSPDYTSELFVKTLEILRNEHGFRGYVHCKAVPGTSPELLERLGALADRLSVNMELPSQRSLDLLAPEKGRQDIIGPMRLIHGAIAQDRQTRSLMRRTGSYLQRKRTPCKERAFAPAGQSTQMIVGATPESDFQILKLSSSLYRAFDLKRVFFSAYVPVVDDPRLPSSPRVQLDREHRLYQADWLMRFYCFDVDEIIDEEHPFLDPLVDPKANWALNHLDVFPIEVNTASYELLLRVPGIGVKSAKRIVRARRHACLRESQLRKIGVVYKRARFFITCAGVWQGRGTPYEKDVLRAELSAPIDGGSHGRRSAKAIPGQMSLFEESPLEVSPADSCRAGDSRLGNSGGFGLSCAESGVSDSEGMRLEDDLFLPGGVGE